MNKPSEVEAFWQAYLAFSPEEVELSPGPCEAWSFCDDEKE